jgi:hypothetical protein
LGLALNPALPPWPDESVEVAAGSSSGSASSGGGSRSSSGAANRKKQLKWYQKLPWDRPLPPIINPVDYEAWATNGLLVFENVVALADRWVGGLCWSPAVVLLLVS